jgi:hypothetical protein
LATTGIWADVRLAIPYIMTALLSLIGVMVVMLPEEVIMTLAVPRPDDVKGNTRMLNANAKVK